MKTFFKLSVLLGTCITPLCGTSPEKVHSLYSRTDPKSVVKQLAFSKLYPNFPEGQAALKRSWELLSQGDLPFQDLSSFDLNRLKNFSSFLNFLIFSSEQDLKWNEEDLNLIEYFSKSLANRSLQGNKITDPAQALSLPASQIDLSRTLLLHLLDNNPGKEEKIRSFEASLDWMALLIRARLDPHPSPFEIIHAINSLIFYELRFRFPPESLYHSSIDFYTFLPSVLQSRKGVCLGVSTLYLCLAQRLGLSLEAVTPPGHIYLRYKNKDEEVNIETTARGISLDSETYLGINTYQLQTRSIKEVIGLNFFNQASRFWQERKHQKAIAAYEKALLFLPDDPLGVEFLAYNYFALGEKDKALRSLKSLSQKSSEHSIYNESPAFDLLDGNTDIEGVQHLFSHVDETRESILKKRDSLELTLEKFPHFRAGLFHLSITYLQLNQQAKALEILQKYHSIEPNNPSCEYTLSILYKERFDFKNAWKHYLNTKALLEEKKHEPEALKALHRELRLLSPPPKPDNSNS